MFRIHDILVWIRIRIRGSIPLNNGSGSGFWIRILLFSSLTTRKLIFFKVFCLLLFECTVTSFFKNNKSQNSRNQGFSYYFCLLIEGSGSGPDPYLWQMDPDPDPGGPKYVDPEPVDPDPDSDPEHWCVLITRVEYFFAVRRRARMMRYWSCAQTIHSWTTNTFSTGRNQSQRRTNWHYLPNTKRVTKWCRPSWLTNSALVYEPKCWGSGGVAESQPISTAVHRSPNKLWISNSIYKRCISIQYGRLCSKIVKLKIIYSLKILFTAFA